MLIKNLKLLLATSALLVGGTVGFAAARGADHDRQDMKDTFDENKDGKLDDAERAKLKAAALAMHGQRKAERLATFDTNKDGKLDDAERAVMRQQRVTERFKKLDANGDGALSLDEFRAHQVRDDRGGRGHRRGMGKRP
ncbi:MAG: calcium-binding protein [Deltaproteobacteria bacterium]|nr:calcium-binding protein [Deltaproteobacteria bacterium]